MYPTHTQLVAKWSSPSIGDQPATGCSQTISYLGLIWTTQLSIGMTSLVVFFLSIFIKKVNSFPFCTHRVLKNTHSSFNKL